MPPDTGGQAHGADIRCRNCGDITVLLQTLTIRCWHSLAEGLMQDRGAHTGSHSSTLIRNSLVAIIPNARARHRLLTRFAMPGASPSGQGWTPETGFSNGSLSGSPRTRISGKVPCKRPFCCQRPRRELAHPREHHVGEEAPCVRAIAGGGRSRCGTDPLSFPAIHRDPPGLPWLLHSGSRYHRMMWRMLRTRKHALATLPRRPSSHPQGRSHMLSPGACNPT